MRLDAVHLQNFKSFSSTATFPLGSITLLYGPNSSGKSSMLQALMLLKQSGGVFAGSVKPSLEFRGPLVDLGGFGVAINEHDVSKSLDIALDFSGSAPRTTGFNLGERRQYVLQHEWDEESRQARLIRVAVRNPETRRVVPFATRREGTDLYLATEAGSRALLDSWVESRVAASSSFVPPEQENVSFVRGWLRRTPTSMLRWVPYWSPRELNSGRPGRPVGGSLASPRRQLLQEVIFDWQNAAFEASFELDNFLTQMSYVGPLREAPRRVHVEGGSVAQGMGSKGERAARLLARDTELLARVNAALEMLEIPYAVISQDVADTGIASAIGELSALVLRDTRTGTLVTPGDVGFGISQILPVVLQLLLSVNAVICIEQPEIHLHPKLQSRLADVILASAELRNNQVVVETHSEHLLLRLQRRIRSGNLDAADLSILYVDRAEGGFSRVTKIALDEKGQFETSWPSGFFDERLEDLLADDREALILNDMLGK